VGDATVIEGPVPAFVRDLKVQPGADIGVHGSIGLARSLLASNLVDELRLVISPVVAAADEDSSPTGRLARWNC
jgi:dihydrofolate reductase